MNERIQELVNKAKSSIPSGLIPEEWLEQYHQTFAELIVRECATIADTDFLPKGVGCGYVTYTKGERIKQHFGVEE